MYLIPKENSKRVDIKSSEGTGLGSEQGPGGPRPFREGGVCGVRCPAQRSRVTALPRHRRLSPEGSRELGGWKTHVPGGAEADESRSL